MPDFLVQTISILTGNVIPALVVLTAVVFVHEMGHFLVARWCGIRVAAFSIGFGREIAGFNDRRGTRWKISAIPLGGYVRFEGDENAASIPDPEALARVPSAQRRGLFHFAPLWHRAAVVAAGPAANFILSILVFTAVFTVSGRPHTLPRVEAVEPGSPAERAGFLPGDVVVSINGDRIDSFSDLQSTVMLAAGNDLSIVVDRSGEIIALRSVPERRERVDPAGRTYRIGVLGISSGEVIFQRDDLLTGLLSACKEVVSIVDRTLTYIGRLILGRESADQLSGVVGIVQISGVISTPPGWLMITAAISVSIGLFNLFPVPMLDGGHLIFYLLEALRGRPLSVRAQDFSFRLGFALVITLFVFVTFNDFYRSGWF